jgi:hypothetical protein
MKRLFKANGTRKQEEGIAIIIYDKGDFKPKLVRRDKKVASY